MSVWKMTTAALALGAAFALAAQPAAPAQKPVVKQPVVKQPAAPATQFDRIAAEAGKARESNQMDQAIALYKQAVQLRPSWSEGWWYLGTLYYDLDEYVDGRNAFRRITMLKPDVSVGWAMLGLCEYQTKQYDIALVHLRRANTLGLDQVDQIHDVALYHLALLLTRYEDYEGAETVLRTFAIAGKDSPDFVEAMGIAALRKPLLPSELPPTERELVMGVGRAQYDAVARHEADSLLEFKMLTEKYPNEPNIYYLYGAASINNDADRGLALMKKAVELDPRHVPALVTIAAEYLRREDYKSALPYATQALQYAPNSYAAHTLLGRCLMAEGKLPAAIAELEKSVKLSPDSPQPHFALAEAYAKAGRTADAARERAEFLRLKQLTAGPVVTP